MLTILSEQKTLSILLEEPWRQSKNIPIIKAELND